MNIVRTLQGNDQRVEQPGIYLMANDRFLFGLKPQRSTSGLESVPFEWATEFPPLGEFMLRFPGYWKADKLAERWLGADYNPVGIYWSRFDPKALVK